METPKEYHYTYYSYEEWGRGYFGSRTCKCLPEKDIKYFGSFKDKTFKPTQKIILKEDYDTREEAYADEIILQQYYKVVENPHFANRAYQTSTGFSRKGMTSPNKGKKMADEQRNKLSDSCKGRIVKEETRQKISKSSRGRKLTEEHKKKIGESNKGKSRQTEEGLERLKKMQQERKGKPRKPHTKESKRKMSEKNKGRTPWNKGKSTPEFSRGKHPRAKRIEFEGIVYECVKDALDATGRSQYYIQKYATYL
jgi:hypothetical protein